MYRWGESGTGGKGRGRQVQRLCVHCTYPGAGRIEISAVGSHYDRTYKLNTRVKDNSRKESSEKSSETHKNIRTAVFSICENYYTN